MNMTCRTILLCAGGGLLLSAGCVPIPGSARPQHGGMRPQEKIGTSPRDLLRPHHSTRHRVVAVLGPPGWVTTDGRTLVYAYDVVSTWLIYPFPFGVAALPNVQPKYLRLNFDAAETLASHTVHTDRDNFFSKLRGRLIRYSDYRHSSGAGAGEVPLPPISHDAIGGPHETG